MRLTAEHICLALSPRATRFYQQADSTNEIALEWLREDALTGSVVVADEQLKGRGRKGRSWHTPPGVALAVSVILHPPPETLNRVSMLGALALCELVENLGIPNVGVKWPNDVQINGLKVSGVLPENEWNGDNLVGVVLGMGLNVRVDFAGSELENTAVSVESAVGKPVDRLQLLVNLLSRVDEWSARLDSAALYDAWKNRLTTIGQTVTVNNVESTVHGVAEAVDEQGALLVRDHQGVLHRVIAGDIGLSGAKDGYSSRLGN
jgi:BirA family transcriptional regulator, biotin operon repressor / biotin---[acetyl-CoA-carboxylase] ligase